MVHSVLERFATVMRCGLRFDQIATLGHSFIYDVRDAAKVSCPNCQGLLSPCTAGLKSCAVTTG